MEDLAVVAGGPHGQRRARPRRRAGAPRRGRIYERTAAGAECEWGEITLWKPPRRLGYLWHLRRDRTDATDVEITFVDGGGTTTREANLAGWCSLLPHVIAYYAQSQRQRAAPAGLRRLLASAPVVAELAGRFAARMVDRDGRAAGPGDRPELLEKTPRNALRVPFLAAVFPDARFVYLYREPVETISSMVEGWRTSVAFTTYPDLPGWPGPPWSFLLVPGWRELAGRPVPEIAARQWAGATEILLADLAGLAADRWCVADFARLLADPAAEVARVCDFLGWAYDRPLAAPLPLSGAEVTPPERGKWRRNAAELEAVLPLAGPGAERARSVLAARR